MSMSSIPPPPRSPPFPYTTLFRSQKAETATGGGREWRRQYNSNGLRGPAAVATREGTSLCIPPALARDRKSTRLNSSHITISYAVFCLKKKKNTIKNEENRTKRSS